MNKKILLLNTKNNKQNIISSILKIYLVRHGYANNNHGIFEEDSKLMEYGIKQATDINEYLNNIKFNAIYCSPLSRCIQTSQYALTGKTIQLDDRLVEIASSISDQRKNKNELIVFLKTIKTNNYILRNVENEYFFSIESIENIKERVIDFFDYIVKNHPKGGTILIISHYEWLRLFYKIVTNENSSFDNCQIKIVQLDLHK
jgi:probable phosphoglycerate mutase